jgi:hypothetical protein
MKHVFRVSAPPLLATLSSYDVFLTSSLFFVTMDVINEICHCERETHIHGVLLRRQLFTVVHAHINKHTYTWKEAMIAGTAAVITAKRPHQTLNDIRQHVHHTMWQHVLQPFARVCRLHH